LGKFNAADELPSVRKIERVTFSDTFPQFSYEKVAIFIGAHANFTPELTQAVEVFCEKTGAAVFCDHTSSYKGSNRFLPSLLACQVNLPKVDYRPDLLIHIGEITGDYSIYKFGAKEVWRVSEDGELRDTFRSLTHIFQMRELDFFSHYAHACVQDPKPYYLKLSEKDKELRQAIPELPLSNIWMASRLAHRIPELATVHFAILNSLRSWNFFEMPAPVSSASNVGGFGIDGNLSTLIGASWANPDRPFYCIIGDLAFFYDMNSLGNRHVGKNLRILLINNGKGTEFLTYKHRNTSLGEDAGKFVAASGHFGTQSKSLVRHYAEDLGFVYLTASTKEEFASVHEQFLQSEISDRPVLFEVFTNSDDEHEAHLRICNISPEPGKTAKSIAKKFLGDGKVAKLKRFIGDS
jgi:2-succinyl-5-enolpyruvyl-6-hydroxy-3-cyclohexene-1-carboxylate synthase